MPISEFWLTIGDRFFFHSAIEQDYFFSQNQSKEIFFLEKNPSPPQNIKWTVPYGLNIIDCVTIITAKEYKCFFVILVNMMHDIPVIKTHNKIQLNLFYM